MEKDFSREERLIFIIKKELIWESKKMQKMMKLIKKIYNFGTKTT
jgi:hypothetical protein